MTIRDHIKMLQKYDPNLESVVQVGNVFVPVVEAEQITVAQKGNSYLLAEEANGEVETRHAVVAIAGGL